MRHEVMAGKRFTPRTPTGERYEWRISDKDLHKVTRGGRWTARVTNLNDGLAYLVEGTNCESPACFCDAVVIGQVTGLARRLMTSLVKLFLPSRVRLPA